NACTAIINIPAMSPELIVVSVPIFSTPSSPKAAKKSCAMGPDLIAGINAGLKADSRSVGQISSRHIASDPDGGVVAAHRVAAERLKFGGGVCCSHGGYVCRSPRFVKRIQAKLPSEQALLRAVMSQ